MRLQKITLVYHNRMKNVKHFPPEDFAYSLGHAFAVCDGVTLLHYKPYPNSSPAAQAARIVAMVLVRELRRRSPGPPSIHAAFIKANNAIREYNRSIGTTSKTVDHLSRQYAATVAAFGTITGNTLHWGQINDCGVMIIDSYGKIIMQQQLDRKPFDQYLAAVRKRGRFKANSPEEHQYVRKEVVNNLQLKYQGKRIFWGVMTGEPQASAFLRVGKIQIKPGSHIVFYSDGAEPFLKLKPFRLLVTSGSGRQRINRFVKSMERRGKKFQHERTIILISLKD